MQSPQKIFIYEVKSERNECVDYPFVDSTWELLCANHMLNQIRVNDSYQIGK